MATAYESNLSALGSEEMHGNPCHQSHQVNDVEYQEYSEQTEQIQAKEQPERESSQKLRCYVHHGKIMDIYCTDHEEICCGTCVLLKHRMCKTKSVQEAAKDFKSGDEVKQYQDSLKEIRAELDHELAKRTDNILSIEQSKTAMLERVDASEEELISRIKHLAEASRTSIRDMYGDHKQALDSDVDVLREVVITATECVDTLELTNEELLFTNAYTGKSSVKEMKSFLQSMSSEWRELGIKFTIDEKLKTNFEESQSLGIVEDCIYVQEYKAAPYTKLNIGSDSEDEKRRIFDMCIMDSGNVMLTDTDHNKLSRYSPELRLVDSIDVCKFPVAVCPVDINSVAVRSFSNGRVQLISEQEQMQVKSSFSVVSEGYGMTYEASEQVFFVCENDRVSVYSRNGTHLRKYETTNIGEKIFAKCRQITVDVRRRCL